MGMAARDWALRFQVLSITFACCEQLERINVGFERWLTKRMSRVGTAREASDQPSFASGDRSPVGPHTPHARESQ